VKDKQDTDNKKDEVVETTAKGRPVPLIRTMNQVLSGDFDGASISEQFSQKAEALRASAHSAVYDGHTPEAKISLQSEDSVSLSQARAQKDIEQVLSDEVSKIGVTPVTISVTESNLKVADKTESKPSSESIMAFRSVEIPTVTQSQSDEDVKSDRIVPEDTYESLLSEEREVQQMKDRAGMKGHSIEEELKAVRNRYNELSATRSNIEKKEREAEEEERRLDSLSREALSAEKRRELEESRWKFEDIREEAEKERWEIDQGLLSLGNDIKAMENELASIEHEIDKYGITLKDIARRKKRFEVATRQAEIEAKLAEIVALKAQVVNKQSSIRDEGREIETKERSALAEDETLRKRVEEIEKQEAIEKNPEQKHDLEKKRWDIERKRRVLRQELWTFQDKKREIEEKRAGWSTRQVRFEQAESELRRELKVIEAGY